VWSSVEELSVRQFITLLAAASLPISGVLAAPPSAEAVAKAALRAAPVFDGHNDVPEALRDRRKNMLAGFDFRDTRGTADPAKDLKAMHTDLTRLEQGRVGAQFWSVYVSAELPEPQAVQATLEQIDVAKRLIARHPEALQFCTTSLCVSQAMRGGRVASLLGMEGGHSIGGSLAVLRQMHALGVRYMTLTHFKNLAWADSGTDAPKHGGLTPFGEQVVREMQRLGMLVDLSHVSPDTMRDALKVARAPVIFSHSNALALGSHPRNVPDDVLDLVKANGGIVMVNVYPPYVNDDAWRWSALRDGEEARLKAMHRANPAAVKPLLTAWEAANPMPRGSVNDVARHLDHVARRIGADHVGLGGDYDGVGTTIAGLEDVSTYPVLFTELARMGWSQADLEKLASRNMLRVMQVAEAYAAARKGDLPLEKPTSF
jgi:membrane dipeptidase